MSDSIIVRVTLDSYDIVHPAEKQTQVYVQIPEVARASWLLDASFYAVLKNEPWPHVIDSAHEEYMRRGVVSDSTSEAARKAIVDWLLLSEGADYDERYDAVHAAWEADQARQHPVARKLLKENEQLRARVAELEAERHETNESLSTAAEQLRRDRDRIAELEAAERHRVYREKRQALLAGIEAAEMSDEVGGWRKAREIREELAELVVESGYVVAYRNPYRPGVLLCREHGDGWAGLTPLTSEDLPDGGLCTYGDPADPADRCGRDVLIPQTGGAQC